MHTYNIYDTINSHHCYISMEGNTTFRKINLLLQKMGSNWNDKIAIKKNFKNKGQISIRALV